MPVLERTWPGEPLVPALKIVPVKLMSPAMSSFLVGEVVPMPTRPDAKILICSVPFGEKLIWPVGPVVSNPILGVLLPSVVLNNTPVVPATAALESIVRDLTEVPPTVVL